MWNTSPSKIFWKLKWGQHLCAEEKRITLNITRIIKKKKHCKLFPRVSNFSLTQWSFQSFKVKKVENTSKWGRQDLDLSLSSVYKTRFISTKYTPIMDLKFFKTLLEVILNHITKFKEHNNFLSLNWNKMN